MPSVDWQVATIAASETVSERVKLFRLAFETPLNISAGQHVDIRLTAPDGYQAQRSYSISSDPSEGQLIELAIEKISDGEVSSYLHEFGTVGTQLEARGPIGGPFTLKPNFNGRVLFIAGGIGIAPLMSMLRMRASTGGLEESMLLYSVRAANDLIYTDELLEMSEQQDLMFTPTLTRETPRAWLEREDNRLGRFSPSVIKTILEDRSFTPDRSYLCGGTQFVESLSSGLVDIGIDPSSIRTERFGP